MIGKLRGILEKIYENHVLLDVNGVGYIVFCSNNTLSKIGGVGGEISLMIETVVREDAFNLYGFASEEEKTWFHLLTQKVNGVGAKMAISILSCLTPRELALAIAAKDKNKLKEANGVGMKLAERIIIELSDQAGKIGGDNVISFKADENKISAGGFQNNNAADAANALEKLRFGRSESFSAISRIISEKGDLELEGLIKEGLKKLTSRS